MEAYFRENRKQQVCNCRIKGNRMDQSNKVEKKVEEQVEEEGVSFEGIVKQVNRWSRIVNNLTNDILQPN